MDLGFIERLLTPDLFQGQGGVKKKVAVPSYNFPGMAPAAEAMPTGNPINEFVNSLFNVRDRDRLKEQGLD
jgi:hypothetical protein